MIEMGLEEIKKILPQRYPFLFIDKVIELDPGKRAVCIKNVTANEPYFQGHFPGNPVMPGMLLAEAMAQASILLYYSAYKDNLKTMPKYYLGSVKASFKKAVVPGDQIKLEATTVKLIPTGAFVNVKAYVNEVLAAETELIFAVKQ